MLGQCRRGSGRMRESCADLEVESHSVDAAGAAGTPVGAGESVERHSPGACESANRGSPPTRSTVFLALRRTAASSPLAAVVLLAASFAAQAQTATTLVSNTGQASTSDSGSHRAQAFTTGSSTGRYGLTSVGVELTSINGDGVVGAVTVQIFPNGSDGAPDGSDSSKIITLTSPASLTADAVNTFTAPVNSTLDASTTYHVVVSKPDSHGSSGGVQFQRTASTAEDSGKADGWSIADTCLFRGRSTNPWNSSSSLPKIQIRGTTLADSATPVLSTAVVNGTSLALTYDEALDEDSVPVRNSFSVSVNGGTGVAPSSVSVSGMTVTLTLATAVTAGQTVTLSYTVPTGGANPKPIQDEDGNDVAALTNRAVENALSTQLSALSLEDGNGNAVMLSPATFDPQTTEYTAVVANAVESVTLTATKNASGATLAIVGDDDTSTPGEATLDLDVGANTLTVEVTGPGGTFTKTYTVTVTRTGVATLSALSFSVEDNAIDENYFVLPLEPAFDPQTTEYTVYASAVFSYYNLDFMRSDENAVIVIDDHVRSYEVTAGDNSDESSLVSGNNTITLTVKAADGVTTKIYTITVDRTGGKLKGWFGGIPDTHDGSTAFEVTLTFQADITATLDELRQTIQITNATMSNLAAVGGSKRRFSMTITPSSSAPLRVHVRGHLGCELQSIIAWSFICSADGKVFGGLSRWVSTADDARLRALWLTSKRGSWIDRKPNFSPSIRRYVAEVNLPFSELTLNAAPYTSGATVAVSGPAGTFTVSNRWDGGATAKLDVPRGSTTWTVTVTSEDGNETKTYTMMVRRGEGGDAADVRLKTLTVTPVNGTGTVLSYSPSFHLDTEAATFRVRVSSDTDAVRVSVEKNSSDPDVRLMRTETLGLDSLDEDPDLAGIQFELTMDRFDLGGARENRYKSIWVIGPNARVEGHTAFNRRVYQLWITKAAEGVGLATAADPLMAAFENVPLSHDGSSAFTFRMAFSEEVEITPEDMRDHAFVVSGATVTGAERVDGLKSLWELTLEPSGSGAVSILTPLERACTEAGALCTADGRALSVAPALQVAGPVAQGQQAPAPLTASFESVPQAHDGASAFTVRLAFTEDVETTPEDMRDHALTVTGATVTAAARVDDRKDLWELTLEPSGSGTVSILTPLDRACTEAGALCTADGRALTGGLGVQVPGPPALTASFESVPQVHDGTSAFTVRLAFSAPIRNSYKHLRDEALSVTGGTVARARRVDGRSDLWELTVEPGGHGAVTVELAATASCADTRALCTADGRVLSNAIATTVAGPPPLTAAFVSVPAEHDGETEFWLELSFNAAVVQGSKTGIRALLGVTGGSVTRLRRKDDRLDHWRVRVEPASHEAVTVTLSPSPPCGATGAVCTEDGRTFTSALATQIQGPPGLVVADAQVQEAANATLAFAVTLNRAPSGTVTVDYATTDGTATAGSDYTAASGTVTFAAGETEKTVSVAVLDDAHDEGSETLTLTLSNASGAHIADGTATGTINNTDHMPQAWLARFGRTVADQVVDAVSERLRGPGGAGAEVRVAGQDLSGATPDGEATREAEAQARIESLAQWLRGESEEDRRPLQTRALTERDFLTGTSFALTGGTEETGLGSVWGRGALTRFDGREDGRTLDGEVASAMVGADWTLGRAMAGLAVSHSRGEGGYRSPAVSGEVETTLTGLYPYGRYAVDERLSVWGVLGYGEGELVLTPQGLPPMEAETDLAMAAAGVRGTVLRAPEGGGVELAVRSDALAVHTTSEAVPGLDGMMASEADVTRLRFGLEGSRAFRFEGGAALTPSLDIGVRHDGGDAETGVGVDIGAGAAWTDPASGVKMKVDARGLLTHEASGFRERGIAGSLAWDPSPTSALGPSLTLRHSVGVSATGGVDALLNPDTARRLAANDDGDELGRRRFEAVLGYGVPVLGHRFIGTPELGMGVSDTGREVRLGWRLGLARGNERVSFTLGLEAARRESTGDDREPEDRIGLRLSLRW